MALVVATAVGAVAQPIASSDAAEGFAFRRVAGPDRFATAALLAGERGGAATVILASGLLPADGLAAAGVAGANFAPILLAAGDTLPATSAKAIVDANTSKVLLLGGPAALGLRLEAGLRARGLVVERIAGGTRYATSEALAARLGQAGSIEGEPTAVVASGVTFADAVSVGPLAAARGLPILLTPTNTSTPAMEAALAASGTRRVLVIGGTSAVGPAVAGRLDDLGFEVVRLAGANRSATSVAVADWAIEHAGFDKTRIAIARGDDVADALAVAPWAARAEPPVPVLLTAGRTGAGPDLLAALARPGNLDSGTIIGGTGALTFRLETELLAAARTAPVAQSDPAPTSDFVGGGPAPTVPLPPGPAPVAGGLTAQDLIDAALTAGTIDLATSLLYRAYASFGDPGLPVQFAAGSAFEDDSLVPDIRAALPGLSAAQRLGLEPFIRRPNDPASYWSSPTASTSSLSRQLADHFPDHPAPIPLKVFQCPQDSWVKEKVVLHDTTVWACAGQESKIATVVALVKKWYPKEVAFLGQPMPDTASTDKINPDSDLDIYIIPMSTAALRDRGGAEIYSPGGAIAIDEAADRSPSYMQLAIGSVGKTLGERAFVHEFFHVLQSARIQARKGESCRPSWVIESSARWYDVSRFPEAAAEQGDYSLEAEFVNGFQKRGPVPLNSGYKTEAFVWWLFLAQDHGESRVQTVWDAITRVETCSAIDKAVQDSAKLRESFGAFALRNFNRKLPGDPIKPLYNGDGAKPRLPIDKPPVVDHSHEALPKDGKTLFGLGLPPVSAAYAAHTVPTEARFARFDFRKLEPVAALDIQMLVKVGETWKLRKVTGGKIDFCKDKPEDRVTDAFVVLANGTLGNNVGGSIEITTNSIGCPKVATGKLTWRQTHDYVGGSSAFASHDNIIWTIDVRLALDESDTVLTSFKDDGSTWTLTGGGTQHNQFSACVGWVGPEPNDFDQAALDTERTYSGGGGFGPDDGRLGYIDPTDPQRFVLLAIASGSVTSNHRFSPAYCPGGSETLDYLLHFGTCPNRGSEYVPGTITRDAAGVATVSYSCSSEFLGGVNNQTRVRTTVSGSFKLE